MMRNTKIATALVAVFGVATGCAPAPIDQPIEPMESRSDLGHGVFYTSMTDGLSDPVRFDVPENTESLLIEVVGDGGLFSMTKLLSPSGYDVVEAADVVTRSAREVDGLVDWMFPNVPGVRVESGAYELLIRGENRNGGAIGGQDLEIHVYAATRKPTESCGIRLSFLVDAAAVDAAQFELAVDQIVAEVDQRYGQIGVFVSEYAIQPIHLSSLDVQIGERSVLAVVDDVLDEARQDQIAQLGEAFAESVHILLVRNIAEGNKAETINGYSMGLPGPYSTDRPNAAVLVSSAHFVDFDGFLEVDSLSATLAHELGHYFGLYHTSEAMGSAHDPIPDTVQCSEPGTCGSEFEENIMTSLFWLRGRRSSERTRFTPQQGEIIRRHPLCVPMSAPLP